MVSTGISSRQPAQRRTAGLLPDWRKRAGVYVAATAVTGVAALAVSMWLGGNLTQSLVDTMSVGGKGDVTGWGLPASKLVMDISAIGVSGMLLACLLLPGNGRELSATARRCLRSASRLALCWAVAEAGLMIFSWSDAVGRPVTALPLSRLFTDIGATIPDAADFLAVVAAALVIAAAASITRTRWGALILLAMSIANLVPMALLGHPGDGAVEEYSLVVHVIALSLWAGGIAALLTHVRREPALLAVAVPRFSALALVCYLAVAISGVLAALQMLDSVSEVWGSRYGMLVSLKAAALIALGILATWHRRHTVRRIRTGEGGRVRRAFVRLAAAEVAVMVAAVAIAVVMWHTDSPDMIVENSYRDQEAGYPRIAPLGAAPSRGAVVGDPTEVEANRIVRMRGSASITPTYGVPGLERRQRPG